MKRNNGFCKSVLKYIFFAFFFVLLLVAASYSPEKEVFPTDTPPPATNFPSAETPNLETPDMKERLPEEPAWSMSTEAPLPEIPVFSPDLEESEPVGDDFFKDAAFIGNSLLDGLRLHSGISCGDFYAYTSMTVMGVGVKQVVNLGNGNIGTILQGMAQKEYGKVYILLGINEIFLEPEEFSVHYGKLVGKVREIQPNADIYIMSLTPLGKEKSQSNKLYGLERLLSFNDALYDVAMEQECYYLDIYSALADEEGFLPKGDSTDGVHLIPDYYKLWLDYIKCHYSDGKNKAELEIP